jgi:putative transcriptional regulator
MRSGSRPPGILAALIVLVALSNSSSDLRGGQYATGEIAAGNLLVANEKLGDPNFAESVVLIMQHDDNGTAGLVINRRTHVSLSRVFPKLRGASEDPVYVGGPVEIEVVQALFRSPAKKDHMTHISGDVYVSGNKDAIEESITLRAAASKFHVYLGSAGWAPGQLAAEIRVGAWVVLGGGTRFVFDENPDSLWSRLIRESHMRIADSPRRDIRPVAIFPRTVSMASRQLND